MATMSDFYQMADELRKELAALFPRGYVKWQRTGNTETISIRNFSNKPIEVIKLEMLSNDGIAYDITNDVRSISFTKVSQ